MPATGQIVGMVGDKVVTVGCHTCDHSVNGYCNNQGPDCDWIDEIFHGGPNNNLGWKLSKSIAQKMTARPPQPPITKPQLEVRVSTLEQQLKECYELLRDLSL